MSTTITTKQEVCLNLLVWNKHECKVSFKIITMYYNISKILAQYQHIIHLGSFIGLLATCGIIFKLFIKKIGIILTGKISIILSWYNIPSDFMEKLNI